MYSSKVSISARTHDGLHAFEAELVLQGNGEAMKRADDLAMCFEMVINLLGAG